jgi:hypothetical protein
MEKKREEGTASKAEQVKNCTDFSMRVIGTHAQLKQAAMLAE